MIHVHIERLVLDGINLSPGDLPRFQAAVQHELGRLVGERGIAPNLHRGGAVDSVSGGTVQVANRQQPGQLGLQVAGAVCKGIGE